MALRIEVKSDAVETRSGTSKNGKPYSIRSQTAYAYTYEQNGNPKPFPERISLNLEDNQQAYPVGNYALDLEKSIYVGDFGRLSLGRPILVSAKLQAAA